MITYQTPALALATRLTSIDSRIASLQRERAELIEHTVADLEWQDVPIIRVIEHGPRIAKMPTGSTVHVIEHGTEDGTRMGYPYHVHPAGECIGTHRESRCKPRNLNVPRKHPGKPGRRDIWTFRGEYFVIANTGEELLLTPAESRTP